MMIQFIVYLILIGIGDVGGREGACAPFRKIFFRQLLCKIGPFGLGVKIM